MGQQIKISLYNVVNKTTSMYMININNSLTMKDVLEIIGCEFPFFPDYYPYCSKYLIHDGCIPFVVTSNNQILFEVSYEKTLIKDFIDTHSIKNEIIQIKTGFPLAGGIDIESFFHIWNSIFPVLNQIVVVFGLGEIIKEVCENVINKFKRKEQPPQSLFDLIYAREIWNPKDLSEILNIKVQEVEVLLKIFGFIQMKEQNLYVQGDKVDNIKILLEEYLDTALRKQDIV